MLFSTRCSRQNRLAWLVMTGSSGTSSLGCNMHVGLLSGYLLQSSDHDCQKIADIVVMLLHSLAGASVILERFEMYRTHDLPLWAPHVYFQCQGEPMHKLTGVTRVHRRYNFTMHESFQVRQCREYTEEHYVAAEALE